MQVQDDLEVLGEQECRALLERSAIGRVAVTCGALPAIFPVNYVVHGGDIVFMTGEGTKLRAASRNAVVAFEIDGWDPYSRSGWSVLVIGLARELEGPLLAEAQNLPLEPWAHGSRNHYVRLGAEMVSGRRLKRRGVQPDKATLEGTNS
jgi:hypothetical protein